MIRAFEPGDTDAVVQLWRDCGLTRPWNDPHKDIARKLTVQPDLFLISEVDGIVVGTAMIGFDGHRGWVSYFAVAEAQRGKGFGGALMAEAERLLIERGCPKIMLMVRHDNSSVVELYEHLGYEPEQTLILGKRLSPD
ncbi:MAG TPA: GNAT family acetyltransferase [Galbitalea sp.]|nr:GNAT family acetyltransferase [Galbitalea sp.]